MSNGYNDLTVKDDLIVDVYLYQPAGAGVQAVNTPQGPIPVPIPFSEYKNVSALTIDYRNNVITFIKRDGTQVISNAVYVVVKTPKPASEA